MTDLRDKYEVVIGLEVHAQLKTKSKIFAHDSTEFGNEQNTQISPITLGMPGVLPVLNKECVKFKVDNSKILSVVMENNVEIPNTASIGSISTYIFGGIVVLFGTMIIAVTIKKKKVSEISQ